MSILELRKQAWKSKKFDAQGTVRVFDLRKRCNKDQKIALISGIPTIVPKTKIDYIVERLFKHE